MTYPALFTDLYQLTMGQVYLRSGKTAEATFSLFFRSYPPERGYFVLAGVQDAIDHLERLRFSDKDVEHLRSTGRFDDPFLGHLQGLRFTGSVRAMPEGSIFFANEPVMEVTAPVIEGQIVETLLINTINLQSVLATKASRVVHASRGRTVVDFAARRTQGVDAANALARVSYIVGFDGTSNVLAGSLYGIPTYGTMAHSFIETFADEADSFRAYAESFPDTSTFLVDTYDTLGGVRAAIEVAREMRKEGHALRAIRLDSGDLLELATRSRALLDESGLADVEVFASGGLDEYEVDALLRGGAPIDGFGVGTKVGVSEDAPSTDCAYKLVEYDGRPTLKLSPEKQSLPGRKQVFRCRDDGGGLDHDLIGLADGDPPDGQAEPLLIEVMSGGRRVTARRPLRQLREDFGREYGRLPNEYKSLRSPDVYPVERSEELDRLGQDVLSGLDFPDRPEQ